MKKLLSIVLITAMVLALVPSAFATTTETDMSNLVRAYNFDFGAAGYAGIAGQTGETEIDYATLRDFGDTKDESGTYTADPTRWATTNTDPWVVDGNCYARDMILTSDSFNSTSDQRAGALYLKTMRKRVYTGTIKEGSFAFAIRLKIDKPGTYFPKLTFWANSGQGQYNVYLIPASHKYMSDEYDYKNTVLIPLKSTNGANAIYTNATGKDITMTVGVANAYSDNNKLGTIDMYAATAGEISTELTGNNTTNPKSLNSIKVTETDIANTTEYYLYIRSYGVNSTIASSYGTNSTTNVHTNLFSFELYEEAPVVEEPTEQEKAEAEFVPSTDDSYEASPASATVNTLALYGEASEAIGTETVTYGETATIDAVPATVTKADGTYNFLYWAKGLEEGVSKQILSTSNAAFAYKPHEGANYLIAVYEKEGEANEAFYNNNGQLLTDLKIVDGVLPALPAMAGRGNAAAWVQRGTNDEFAGGAAAPTSGNMVFMAKYEEVEDNITINGESYSYGDIVSCKDIVAGMDNFSYFTRKIGDADAEIISIDADYSFAAYTDCTIEAVCNGAVTLVSPKKIALSTFSVGDKLTAVMAEFIGFENAKEKGIMFGNKKIAMTSNKAQFTITNDTAANVTVTGYAIVGNDKYIDGEITVAAMEK